MHESLVLTHDYLNPKDYSFAEGWNQSAEFETRKLLKGEIANGFRLEEQERPYLEKEVLLVDRNQDLSLQELIEKARYIKKICSVPIDQAYMLSELVIDRMTNRLGWAERLSSDEIIQLAFKPIYPPFYPGNHLIGDISSSKGKPGVCRHKALLFHVLAGDIGLNVSSRLGIVDSIGHMWNEVQIDNLNFIIDLAYYPTHSPFLLPSVLDKVYLNHRGNKIYN